MALLSRVGRAVTFPGRLARTAVKNPVETGAVIAGAAFLGGINSQDPLQPYTDLLQEEATGDPQGFKKIAGAYISTYYNDSFRGNLAQDSINSLRNPTSRPKFNVPGDIVLGMYNSRHG